MKSKSHRSGKWLAMLAVFASCGGARAATITFATFSDTATNKWNYSGGTLTAVNDPASFFSFGPPNQVLAYSGPVTYSVKAIATGAPTFDGTFIQQAMNGEMVFMHNTTTVLDVVFAGALITGQPGSNSSALPADTTIAGTIISYNADPSVLVGGFSPPFSFSIALTQIPGITISGGNLADFTATATGSFAADQIGGGAGPPTPLPPAFLGGPALLVGIAGLRWVRRKMVNA
jgi:hypothetical protein